jgi:CheY-like chemotaxis protein
VNRKKYQIFLTSPFHRLRRKPPRSALNGTETILLAEDHDSIRELTRQSLTRLGYKLLAAAGGGKALRLVELERPDLAVLYVVMPRMGGATTATQLLQHMPGLPILFTSGFSQERKQHRGPGSGISLPAEALRPNVSGKHDPGNPGQLIIGN